METAELAAFVEKLRDDRITTPLEEVIGKCMLDFAGVAASGGRPQPASDAIRRAFERDLERAGSVVVGQSTRYSSEASALLNGAFAHSDDFDDTNATGTVHPGSVVIAAVLSVVGNESGADLMTALVAGYEVTARVGKALGPTAYDRGFHPTALAGIFGAIAAVASLHRMSASEIEHCWGIAGSMASGSMQFLHDGSWNKRLHPGWSAYSALVAVRLARAGFIGSSSSLEGEYGLLRSHSDDPQPAVLTAGLGTEWLLLDTAIKPYPSCRYCHSAVDAAIELSSRVAGNGMEGATVTVQLSEDALQIVGRRQPQKLRPKTSGDAQFSIYFQVASALLDGWLGMTSFDVLDRPKVLALAERMEVVARSDFAPLQASVTLRTAAGATHVVDVKQPSGEPPHPMSWELVGKKFDSLTERIYTSVRRSEVTRLSRNLRALPAARELVEALAAEEPA